MKHYLLIILLCIPNTAITTITDTTHTILTGYITTLVGSAAAFYFYEYFFVKKPLTKEDIKKEIDALEFDETVLFFLEAIATITTSKDTTEALEESVRKFTEFIEDIDNRMPYHTIYEPHLDYTIKRYHILLHEIENCKEILSNNEKKELKKKKYFLQNDYIKLKALYALLTSSELYHLEKRAYLF